MKLSGTSSVVIDANIVVFAVWPTAFTTEAQALLARLRSEGKVIHVPELWRAEVVSALHRLGMMQGTPREKVHRAVRAALKMAPKRLPLDAPLCLAALTWAERLGQAKAYDAFYLALAERLGAEFWTADKRLVNSARQVGAGFVRLLGEAQTAGGNSGA